MACFTVPVAGAVITAMVRHSLEKKTPDRGNARLWSTKLKWLEKLSLGGSALLALEHLWHGEITLSFPFLTAALNGGTMEILKETATAGSTMMGLVLLVWGGMIVVTGRLMGKEEVRGEA